MDTTLITTLLSFLEKLSPGTMLALAAIIFLSPLCVVALIIVLWHRSDARSAELLRVYRDDMQTLHTQQRERMQAVDDRYRADMLEQRRMYENNVELVKDCVGLSKDQRDVLLMVVQTMTTLCDSIKSNEFCPMIRLKKVTGVPE